MTIPKGMSQSAFKAYVKAMYQAGINPAKTSAGTKRVVQTLGFAGPSAGTHAKDGVLDGREYSAAVDISTVHDLSQSEVERLLVCLWKNGFIAWWRNTGSFANNQHIHAVYAGVHMKASLRAQVHSFLKRRSGLVSDNIVSFVQDNLTEPVEQSLRTLFLSRNQAVGGTAGDMDVNEDTYVEYLGEETCCGAIMDDEPADEDE